MLWHIVWLSITGPLALIFWTGTVIECFKEEQSGDALWFGLVASCVFTGFAVFNLCRLLGIAT